MRKLLAILKEWKEELWGIPVACLLLFVVGPKLIQWVDPTAGLYDAGIMQVILFAIIALLIYNGVAWLGIKQIFPEVFDYFQKEFATDFKNLEKCQKLKVSVLLYLAFLAALVVLTRVI
jgi:hypothetical protein